MNWRQWCLATFLIVTAFYMLYNSGFTAWIFWNIYQNGEIRLYDNSRWFQVWEMRMSLAILVAGYMFFCFLVGYIYEKARWS